LDIVIWTLRAPRASIASRRARDIFTLAARHHLHLAVAELPASFFDLESAGIESDRDTLTCLRSVLMKPEHRTWIERIWSMLDVATDSVLQRDALDTNS
jgi:tyrosine decarboxylase/aspartate 1-decarboxylase